jgi:hypothetical protein
VNGPKTLNKAMVFSSAKNVTKAIGRTIKKMDKACKNIPMEINISDIGATIRDTATEF